MPKNNQVERKFWCFWNWWVTSWQKLGSFSLLMNKPNIFIGINNNQGLHLRTVYGQMSKINQLNILIFWVLVTFLEFWWNLSILDWCQCPIHTNLEKKEFQSANDLICKYCARFTKEIWSKDRLRVDFVEFLFPPLMSLWLFVRLPLKCNFHRWMLTV